LSISITSSPACRLRRPPAGPRGLRVPQVAVPHDRLLRRAPSRQAPRPQALRLRNSSDNASLKKVPTGRKISRPFSLLRYPPPFPWSVSLKTGVSRRAHAYHRDHGGYLARYISMHLGHADFLCRADDGIGHPAVTPIDLYPGIAAAEVTHYTDSGSSSSRTAGAAPRAD